MTIQRTVQELEKQIAILELAAPMEEDLYGRIDEMQKYLAMQDGFTLPGIARLLNECQKRMAADWIEAGRLRREVKELREGASEIMANFVRDRRVPLTVRAEMSAAMREVIPAIEMPDDPPPQARPRMPSDALMLG